ncbi:intraflagellar transport protein 25 homolog isoform X1 [Pteronotus mesoamericanus]|uniref:intraflagellar transport protein 25 homolog isoform X1 n=2 Tax=Pteronotus mesoamericanus TaxID=1884717 RepID=UPI0023EC989A|nr:intraflagellar transport protein 25 homolog isoform X1 [Pteronotus parnellii mesoamericanus]
MCLGVGLFAFILFGTLCFLDLYVYFLHQIKEVFFHYFFRYSFSSHLASSYISFCPITIRTRRRVKQLKMRKVDLCLSSEGAEVILATSSDEKHPPENMIDGNPETFWTTTGMFPQEFIICFHKHVRIERLVIQSYFVRTLRIEKSTSKEPVDFEQWIERDLVHTEGQLQNEEIMAHDGHATYLRFIITSAFDHFAAVYSISAEGMAV